MTESVGTAASENLGSPEASLERFRAVLAEYDVVATGVKTLSRRLSGRPEPAAARLLTQLQNLRDDFGLQREAAWRLQVSDEKLARLLHVLTEFGGDEALAPLCARLEAIKRLLAPLSHALETLTERRHDSREAAAEDHAEEKTRNLDRMAYELAFGRSRLNSAPLRHVFDTTSRCNLRCLTCYQSATQELIHYDLADVHLEALKPALGAARQIFIAGVGEPLLSRSAFDLIEAARKSGAHVEAITNGTTLARASRALASIDTLMISFDGGTSDSYDAVRRHGSFDRLVRSVRELSPADRAKVCFNTVVCKQNVYSIDELVDLAVELGVGQVHLQEMTGYLPWHDRMMIDLSERGWLSSRLNEWRERAAAGGVTLVCNLVPGSPEADGPAVDRREAQRRSIEAVSNVLVASTPPRSGLEEVSAALERLLAQEPPPIFALLSATLMRLAGPSPSDASSSECALPEELDWNALRAYVDADEARFPHCMSTYAHLVVNGDGTTRSCCKVLNRLADVDRECFEEIWNADTYVELRTAHAAQIAPCQACRNCRDPIRFHFVPEVLETLAAHGIDVSRIRRPKDFALTASCAEHPLVRRLGASELDASAQDALAVRS